ncbi:hypothetical protein [Pseudomonas silesiensis]|uniref:hypothetical protein n=1 Tax=Pseudomonas silesiensis TaxID=1853130 RepID=UPI0038621A6D
MRGVDDGMRQAVVAVEVFGFVAQRVDFGDEVAFGVVADFSDSTVQEGGFGELCGAEVILGYFRRKYSE